MIARILSPYELGVYAVALATVGLISLFQSFGLYGFVVREPDMTTSLQASAFTINAGLSIILACLIAIASVFGGALLQEAGVRKVMLLLSALPIIGGLQFLPEANLERFAQFRTISIIGTCKTAISQGLAVTLAFAGQSYMSLAYGQLAAAVFGLLAFNVVGRKYVAFKLGFSDWRRILKFGSQMMAINGVASITDRAADFILARILGLNALGLYSRASNLNNLLWENIHLITGRVLFVDLAQRKRAGDSLRESYIRINDINTVVLWPAFIGLAVVSGPFIRIVYGSKWVTAAQPLCLLTLASVIYVSLSMSWELFVVDGRTATQTRVEYQRTLFASFAFALGCLVSLTAAAASRIAAAFVTNALYRPHIREITDTRKGDFARIYLRNALITLCAISPSASLMLVYHAAATTPLSYVIASVLFGVASWFIMLKLTRHPLFREIGQAADEVRRVFAGR